MENKKDMKRAMRILKRNVTAASLLRGRGRRILTIVLLSCSLLCHSVAQAHANENRTATEDLIRSAMIYNFCKFVEWPTDGHPLVLGFADAPPERGGWGATVVRVRTGK